MNELRINKPLARSEVLAKGLVDQPGVRCYRNSPSDCLLQIRTKTENQGRMSNVHLSKAECRELGRYLLAMADELTGN